MAPFPTHPDPSAWNRYFAVEANNRAWRLTALPRTPAGDQELLNSAHASVWHWSVVGTELNHMRGRMLLAHVHARLGHGATALSYAEEMRAFFLGKEDTADWEVALTHTVYAHAAHTAGKGDAAREAYREAEAAVGAISDPEDRAVVMETFSQLPLP